jgi:tripartite-type tricarboxylate transporter receptor subunit TctC
MAPQSQSSPTFFSQALMSSLRLARPAFIFATGIAVTIANGADAQTYPTKPIRIISPFSAGSPPDTVVRLVANQMTVRLGQNVVIENRPGAGTTIGIKAGAASDPDGYTVVQTNAALSYAPILYPNAGYDPIKSFTPVALLACWTHVLVGHPTVPANTLQQLIAYAKANPGRLSIASPRGMPPHVLAHLLRIETGADFNDVPYRQTPQLVADLLAGRVQLYFSSGEPVFSMIRDGKLKAYAFTSNTRDAGFPNVPTMAEAGLPNLAISPSDWSGLLAPAGTPSNIVAMLNGAINDALRSPEVQGGLTKLGWQTKTVTPKEFALFISSDAAKWTPVVKAAALKTD